MTQNYNVGDRVKIVRSDNLFSDELGDQTGMVGKVKSIPNHQTGVYVKFKGTKKHFYYTNAEVELVTPPAEPVHEYKAGDYAKIVNGGYGSYSGKVFEVEGYAGQLVTLNLIEDSTKREWVGHFFPDSLEPAEKPVPVAKFKAGDWVKVFGRGDKWDGTVGEVKKIEAPLWATSDRFWYEIHNEAEGILCFKETSLEATEKPFTPKFAVGDWVKVSGWSSMFDGKVYQVEKLPDHSNGYYTLKDENGTDGFSDTYLVAAEAPKPKHWTVAKPVGTAARIGERTIVKVAADKWLFVYHDGSKTRPSTAHRTNVGTATLLGNDVPEFTKAY